MIPNRNKSPTEFRAELEEFLRNLIECKAQAPHDFGGEQREWYVPRLNTCFAMACKLFPDAVVNAMQEAKDPYGDLLVEKI